MTSEITASVPVVVKGYGVEEVGVGQSTACPTRDYFIGDICLCSAQVLYYEGRKDWSPAGFLLEGRLYKTAGDLDTAVAWVATQQLLDTWQSYTGGAIKIELPPESTA